MRSRQFAFAAATIALIAALAGGVSPAQAKTPACKQGTTLAIGKSARVFSVKKNGIRRVYGCASGQKKRSYLGRHQYGIGQSPGVDVRHLAVNGTRVAYGESRCGKKGGNCRPFVTVFDLLKRKVVTRSQAGSDIATQVLDVVLASKGIVAFIASDADTGNIPLLFARAPKGQFVQIPGGADRDSLALAGRRLYWTVNGAPRVFNLSLLL